MIQKGIKKKNEKFTNPTYSVITYIYTQVDILHFYLNGILLYRLVYNVLITQQNAVDAFLC